MKLLKNARIIIKDNTTDMVDILIDEGKILKISKDIDDNDILDIYDLEGRLTIPGGIDCHVHLREPGQEEKEDISTGTRAALRGGYTSIMPMPNLNPCPDDLENIDKYIKLIKKKALVNVYPYSAITKDRLGKELVDMKAIKEKFNINIFSDDGLGIMDDSLMEKAMEIAKENESLIACHTEDKRYIKKGASVSEGEFQRKHGYIGIPNEAEYMQVERDLKLALKIGCKYHICHISTKESVDLLRKYKKLGRDVSAEVTSHHLLLIDEDVKDTNYKMNPPLGDREDRKALIEGLLDGTIDFIANDHAPHTREDKNRSMEDAAFGIVGLETAIPLIYTYFVDKGIFSLEDFVNFISTKPSERFDLKTKGKLKEGYDADILVLEEGEYVIDSKDFLSKGVNTPFNSYKVKIYPKYTFVNGKLLFKNGRVYE